MLTTDPGDSEEYYACKLLEVLIIHCHHSLMQVGGAGPLVGGAGSRMSECGYGQSDVTASGWDLKRAVCGAIRMLADSLG